MPWYKVTLSVQDVHRAETLQDAFSAFFITSGSPKDAALQPPEIPVYRQAAVGWH